MSESGEFLGGRDNRRRSLCRRRPVRKKWAEASAYDLRQILLSLRRRWWRDLVLTHSQGLIVIASSECRPEGFGGGRWVIKDPAQVDAIDRRKITRQRCHVNKHRYDPYAGRESVSILAFYFG